MFLIDLNFFLGSLNLFIFHINVLLLIEDLLGALFQFWFVIKNKTSIFRILRVQFGVFIYHEVEMNSLIFEFPLNFDIHAIDTIQLFLHGHLLRYNDLYLQVKPFHCITFLCILIIKPLDFCWICLRFNNHLNNLPSFRV